VLGVWFEGPTERSHSAYTKANPLGQF